MSTESRQQADPRQVMHDVALRVRARMGRRAGLGAPVRRDFVRAVDGVSPLAMLVKGRHAHGGGGGRGGRTRLSLLLSMLWVMSGTDHSSDRAARFWAELIALPDPGTSGARAVKAAMADLHARNLVKLGPKPEPGKARSVTLRNESGNDSVYSIPNGKSLSEQYFRVPEELWTADLLPDLTGAGLAMYLAVLSVYRTGEPEMLMSFSPATFRGRFGLGDSTRRAGLANLVEAKAIVRTVAWLDGSGSREGRTYRRDQYRLNRWCAPAPPANTNTDDPRAAEDGGNDF